jgi:hypothetical protein
MLIFSACSPIVQRGYVASSLNMNHFDRDNEKNLKISLFANHYELQSNFALTKKFGLSAGINGSFRGQLGGELGGIYYKKFNDKNYFEIQYGYGYFNNKTKIHMAMSLFAGEHGTWYHSNSDVSYHKIFLQPTYFISTEKVDVGFALKISGNYYDRFYYYSRKTIQDDVDENFYHTTDFRYKWNLLFEPAVRLHFNKKFFIQLSGIFSNHMLSSPTYHSVTGHQGGTMFLDQTGTVKSPDHVNFVFTMGYEIKFGKKK